MCIYVVAKLSIHYSAKFWQRKTLANLVKRISFANILPNQISYSPCTMYMAIKILSRQDGAISTPFNTLLAQKQDPRIL